jgi:hypothetical protein
MSYQTQPMQSNVNMGTNNMSYPQMSNNYAQPINNFGLKPMGIPYASKEEIEGYILPPNSQMFAIDRDKPLFYIKSADSLARSTMEIFEFKRYEPAKEVPSVVVENVVTKEDLKDMVTKQDLANVLTTKDLDFFVSRDEFNKLMAQCKDLEKILKVGGKNDKESI